MKIIFHQCVQERKKKKKEEKDHRLEERVPIQMPRECAEMKHKCFQINTCL